MSSAETASRVRPRDAATLILVRRDGPAPAVLMGRRHGGHVFMPDKFVFPGGRIARSDAQVTAASELRPVVQDRLEQASARPRARTLALAAIRETFEETGVLVGRAARGTAPAPGPWRDFFARGVIPDLCGLHFIARAITPPGGPRRFDARFFMTDAGSIVESGAAPQGDGELVDVRWFDLDEAKALELPTITRLVLDEIAKRWQLDHDENDALPVPFFAYRREGAALQLLD